MTESKQPNHPQENPALKRSLKPIHVWALALGSIIGWGAFVLPGTTFLPKGGPLGTLIGMAIAGAIMALIAASYGYMIKKYPVAGGEYTYALNTFGRKHAFVCVWFLILAYLSIVPLNATALGLISRKLLDGLFSFGYLYSIAGYDIYAGEILLSSVVLILMALLSIRGVSAGGNLQATLAIALVASVVIICVAALVSPYTSVVNLQPGFPEGQSSIAGILAIVAVAPWAFIGFDSVPQTAEEFSFSASKATRIMVIAVAFGAFVYIAMNTVTASIMPWPELLAMNLDWPIGDVVETLMGKTGLFILGVALISAVLTGINGFFMATSRLMYSVAQQGVLPAVFGRVDEKSQTPKNAILFVLVISLIAPWFGREVLGWIVDMSSVGAAIGFMYTCASCFATIRRTGENRPALKAMSGLGAVFGLVFLLLLIVPGMPTFLATPSLVCLAIWILMGIAFAITSRKRNMLSNTRDIQE